jgi:hypothetical protein
VHKGVAGDIPRLHACVLPAPGGRHHAVHHVSVNENARCRNEDVRRSGRYWRVLEQLGGYRATSDHRQRVRIGDDVEIEIEDFVSAEAGKVLKITGLGFTG